MTSSAAYTEAYVWIWLANSETPIVAGKIELTDGIIVFNYGQSYLKNPKAIPIYTPELPLQQGEIVPLDGLKIANCIRDAAPDAWGRRVVLNRLTGAKGKNADNTQLSELTYLLESGSDRIGALDFQVSPEKYIPRAATGATLEQLMESADRVSNGIPLAPDLDQALFHGSSIGGARPKALIEAQDQKYIAKFSTSTDLYNVVKAEFIAMKLANLCGIDAAPVNLTHAAGRDILLINRFDRIKKETKWLRRSLISALTLFELDEMMARYASYETMTEIIRKRFTQPNKTLKELFSRLSFNILCGNTDDHARNHAAFWDGDMLTLTPAYDICPQGRTGNEATQAMRIAGENNLSQITICIKAAPKFHLSQKEATDIVNNQVEIIEKKWSSVCDEACLSEIDRNFFWRRQFLNPFALEGFRKI